MKEVKTHVIDGVTYVEVDRKAKVGDMVWLVNIDMPLILRKAHDVDAINEDIECELVKTLEPVEESPDVEVVPPSVVDMLANLARRVSELERETRLLRRENVIASEGRATTLKNIETLTDGVNTLFRNVKTFAEQAESNSEDIRELDSRTQVIDAINKYYAEGSR